MKRQFVTRKKFYDIRRFWKRSLFFVTRVEFSKELEISPATLTRVLKSRNFKEYKQMGNVYGKGVKSLRKRILFILLVLVVVLLLINNK